MTSTELEVGRGGVAPVARLLTQSVPTPTEAAGNLIPAEYPDPRAALWTPTETASVLRVKVGTIDTLHRCGDLPAVRVGKHIRYLPADVHGYVARLRGDGR